MYALVVLTLHVTSYHFLPAQGQSKVHKLGGVVQAADVGLLEDYHLSILGGSVQILWDTWRDNETDANGFQDDWNNIPDYQS